VYPLTYAGGRLPNPGTREPYEHSSSYFHTAGRFLGHSTFGVFDYVVAIDFNRVPGSPVSSTDEPDGPQPGGDVWLHVDNGAPTLGCVTVPRADMVAILKWLDPSQHPVIVLHAGLARRPALIAGHRVKLAELEPVLLHLAEQMPAGLCSA
jgi:hypothetical protein